MPAQIPTARSATPTSTFAKTATYCSTYTRMADAVRSLSFLSAQIAIRRATLALGARQVTTWLDKDVFRAAK